MTAWFLGRTLCRNAAENISACVAMPGATQISIAQHLVDKIESTEGLSNKALVDAPAVLVREANANRQTSPQSLTDPKWNAAGILEIWGNARLGFLTGRISHRAFEKVDALVFRFATATLGPARMDRWRDPESRASTISSAANGSAGECRRG